MNVTERAGGSVDIDHGHGVAASADVEVTLDITPKVPHVFQAYHPILEEAVEALDRAGQFLSAHLTGAKRVTVEHEAERKLSA
jgi:hypothetical protein